jgi:hypothetical protein
MTNTYARFVAKSKDIPACKHLLIFHRPVRSGGARSAEIAALADLLGRLRDNISAVVFIDVRFEFD